MNQRDMFVKWLYYAGAVLLLVLVQGLELLPVQSISQALRLLVGQR